MLREENVLFFLGLISVLNAELPSYITKCKQSDANLNSCLTEQANIALVQLLKGDTSIGKTSLLPVIFPRIYLTPTNVDFTIEIKDSLVYGWDTAHFQDISMDFKKQTFNLEVKGHWQWEGVYNASGQIYNSSYDHKGTWNNSFENATAYFSAEFEPTNIDGFFYIQLKNEVFTFNADNIAYNLVSRESRYLKQANDLMDKFNDIYSDLNKELLPTVKVLCAEIFASIINNILRSEIMCKLFDD